MDYENLYNFFLNEVGIDINCLNGNIKVLENIPLEKIKIFIGCFKIIEDQKIVDYKLVVPKIIDIKTFLINLHEYTHACLTEKQIGFIDIDNCYEEVIPITMERIYLKKYYPEYLEQFNNYQLSKVQYYLNNTNYFYKYLLAYFYQFELSDIYYKNVNCLLEHEFNENHEDMHSIVDKTLKLLKK